MKGQILFKAVDSSIFILNDAIFFFLYFCIFVFFFFAGEWIRLTRLVKNFFYLS